MKKGLFLLMFVVGIAVPVSAQQYFPQANGSSEGAEEGGRMFAGGLLTFWSDPDDKTTVLEFSPEVGYLFNDTWGVGILPGYEYEKAGREGTTRQLVSNALKLSPFVRYYYMHRGPFNLYVDGGVGFSWFKEKDKSAGVSTVGHGFEVGIRPGACVDLTEGLCLCLRMGFLGYRNRYTGGEEERMGNNGFGLRFSPESLMIGLELEF